MGRGGGSGQHGKRRGVSASRGGVRPLRFTPIEEKEEEGEEDAEVLVGEDSAGREEEEEVTPTAGDEVRDRGEAEGVVFRGDRPSRSSGKGRGGRVTT